MGASGAWMRCDHAGQTMRSDPDPPLDSDAEIELINSSPRYAARALLRRVGWSGAMALLFVGALWLITR